MLGEILENPDVPLTTQKNLTHRRLIDNVDAWMEAVQHVELCSH